MAPGRGRVHHPGLGSACGGEAPVAPDRVPHIDAGERARRARDALVWRAGRGARDAFARAFRGGDRAHRARGRGAGELWPRRAVLLLLRRVHDELASRRAQREPRAVRAAVPPAVRPGGRRRQRDFRPRGGPPAVPEGLPHAGRPAAPDRGRAGVAQGRGPHEGAGLRVLRHQCVPRAAGRPCGRPRGDRGGRCRAQPHAGAGVQPRLHEQLPGRPLGQRHDELRPLEQPRRAGGHRGGDTRPGERQGAPRRREWWARPLSHRDDG